MSKILVTGGAGFIGGNFVRYWKNKHPIDDIFVLDSLTYASNRTNLAGLKEVELIVGDIRNTALVERLLRERKIDVVVHFAAETHVDRSIAYPSLFFDTNIQGTASLLQAMCSAWLQGSGRPHRFHHVSTDEVYGSLEPGEDRFTESSPYAPNSPYAASKAASDHLVRAYHRTYGLETTTTNCSNNYGPFQHPEKLIPKSILNAIRGHPLTIYGDGKNVRDWLHVHDHCRAIEACLAAGKPGEVYAIGGRSELTNLEVVERICCEVDRRFTEDKRLVERFPLSPAANGIPSAQLICHVEDRPGHDRRYAIDGLQAESQLGFMPARTFEVGLRETLNWYLANPEWWRNIET